MSNEKLIIPGEQSVECATLEIESVINNCRRDQFAMAPLI